MALHRDIYWVGKQWAVTGHGMQAIDKKLQGKFDIEISRLWDRDLTETLRAEKWFNVTDFSKGLVLARARYPLPAGQVAPPEESIAPVTDRSPVAPPQKSVTPPKDGAAVEPPQKNVAVPKENAPVEPPKRSVQRLQTPENIVPVKDSAPAEPAKPMLQKFQMRFQGGAKFVRPWRVNMRRDRIVAAKDN